MAATPIMNIPKKSTPSHRNHGSHNKGLDITTTIDLARSLMEDIPGFHDISNKKTRSKQLLFLSISSKDSNFTTT